MLLQNNRQKNVTLYYEVQITSLPNHRMTDGVQLGSITERNRTRNVNRIKGYLGLKLTGGGEDFFEL